jgi:ABC-type polysaccharide/polyol phosphate export permease
MAILEHLPDTLRSMFDEGLDEIFIFAIIFIIIIIAGIESDSADNLGILPLVVIAIFLFLFVGLYRNEDAAE